MFYDFLVSEVQQISADLYRPSARHRLQSYATHERQAKHATGQKCRLTQMSSATWQIQEQAFCQTHPSICSPGSGAEGTS